MINFYQEWKDDKESEPRKVRKPKGHQCILCLKRVNGLKEHMDDVHGVGTYKRFLEAEERIREMKRQEFIAEMYKG